MTAVQRGVANTRWRDFADIYVLSRAYDQDGAELTTAIASVATHRAAILGSLATALAGYPPLAQSRWVAWRRKQILTEVLPADFETVPAAVTAFADPCLAMTSNPGKWQAKTGRWASAAESDTTAGDIRQ